MAAGAHFGCPKFTFDYISGHFRSIRNFIFFGNFWQNECRRPFWMSEINFRSHFWPITEFLYIFYKMAAGGHFGCPKFTFDRISGHFRSILNFFFSIAFLAILDQYGFFLNWRKMAAGGHFGCPKFTFDCISGNFRSIGHFGCLKLTFDSNSGHFRLIQNVLHTVYLWYYMWDMVHLIR